MAQLQGYTFAQQSVSPEADGRLYEYMLADGRIFGGDLSLAGDTVNINAGNIIVKGRHLRIPSTTPVSLSSEYSDGYARIVLRLDLSQEASEEQFEQASFKVEYAPTDSWPGLTQSDINDGTSTVYEIEYAVIKLEGYNAASTVRILGFCDANDNVLPQLFRATLSHEAWQTQQPNEQKEFWYYCDVSVPGYKKAEQDIIAMAADTASGAWLEQHGAYEMLTEDGKFSVCADEIPEVEINILYEIKKVGG